LGYDPPFLSLFLIGRAGSGSFAPFPFEFGVVWGPFGCDGFVIFFFLIRPRWARCFFSLFFCVLIWGLAPVFYFSFNTNGSLFGVFHLFFDVAGFGVVLLVISLQCSGPFSLPERWFLFMVFSVPSHRGGFLFFFFVAGFWSFFGVRSEVRVSVQDYATLLGILRVAISLVYGTGEFPYRSWSRRRSFLFLVSGDLSVDFPA